MSNISAASVRGQDGLIISKSSASAQFIVMPATTSGPISLTIGSQKYDSSTNFTVQPNSIIARQQGAKIIASDVTGTAEFGRIAVSADGQTVLIGAPGDNSLAGGVWFFSRTGNTLSQQSLKVTGAGATGPGRHGESVALSADGNTAAFGGMNDNANIGAVWVFVRNGGVWQQQGNKLVGTGYVNFPRQGSAIALSGDGNTLLVGASGDNTQIGAVWVFTRSSGVWTQQGTKLLPSDATGAARFGASIALSTDGNTAVFGGWSDNTNEGAAWIFTRNGNTWVQQGPKLIANDDVGAARQGEAVAISGDGHTVIVGGTYDNGSIGASWVYTRNGGTWTQQGAKLLASDSSGNASQGLGLSMSLDGNLALVGGIADNSNQGAFWQFTRSNSAWTQNGSKLLGSGNSGGAFQGSAIALSTNGQTAIVAGRNDNTGVGAVWLFTP